MLDLHSSLTLCSTGVSDPVRRVHNALDPRLRHPLRRLGWSCLSEHHCHRHGLPGHSRRHVLPIRTPAVYTRTLNTLTVALRCTNYTLLSSRFYTGTRARTVAAILKCRSVADQHLQGLDFRVAQLVPLPAPNDAQPGPRQERARGEGQEGGVCQSCCRPEE